MGSCSQQSFNNVSSGAWSCLVSKAAHYGVHISSNSGSASASGFTIAWNYDPGAQTLSIQCTDKPFWAPCGTVNGKIHDVVEGCMDAEGAAVSPMIGGG